MSRPAHLLEITMKLRFLLLASAVGCLTVAASLAQSITGTVQGVVTDTSGAVITGASVTARNVATGFTRSGSTNATGAYAVPFLPAGEYQVEVQYQGFEKALRKGITLGADQKVDLAFTLTPGNITETMTVAAEAPVVNSASSEVGQSIPHKTVVDLPLNGRNFAALVYLAPGVQTGRVGEQAGGGGPSAWRSNIAFNANGMRATTNSYLLDGIDNNELGLDFTVSVLPVVDAIQEFKIQTNNFSAEFGRALGGLLLCV
jgi:hypothetical protein